MGQYEIALRLNEELSALGATRDSDIVRVTRQIEIKGPREWVVQTISKSFVPALGDYRTLTEARVVACTDCRAEVVDGA